MKRTASRPTSSTTSRSVTKSPERFDIFTGSPPRSSRTSWQSLTSSSAAPSGDRLHRRLHPLDVAAVIGAPDVDHRGKAALELRAVIGDVGGEIGVGAVRFEQRPVDVVAECRRAEQRLLAVLPILDRLALGRRQPALVDRPRARSSSIVSPDLVGLALRAASARRRTRRAGCRAPRGRRGSSPSWPSIAASRTTRQPFGLRHRPSERAADDRAPARRRPASGSRPGRAPPGSRRSSSPSASR